MEDLKNNCQSAVGIQATLAGTTPSKGNIVDLQSFESATLFLQTGVVTDAGTASGFAFEIQESDTTADAAFTAVADADLIGTEASLTVTDDTQDGKPIGSIGYIGSKRYIRVVSTGTTGTDAVVSGIWVKSHTTLRPPTSTAANIAAT